MGSRSGLRDRRAGLPAAPRQTTRTPPHVEIQTMTHRLTLSLFLSLALVSGLILIGQPSGEVRDHAVIAQEARGIPQSPRVVFLVGDLADEDRIRFTTAVVASGHPGLVLFDAPQWSGGLKQFLTAFQPERVIRV